MLPVRAARVPWRWAREAGAARAAAGGSPAACGLKVATVVAAPGVVGGTGVAGRGVDDSPGGPTPCCRAARCWRRPGGSARRLVPGNGVARGKPNAPGQRRRTRRPVPPRRPRHAQAKKPKGRESGRAQRAARAVGREASPPGRRRPRRRPRVRRRRNRRQQVPGTATPGRVVEPNASSREAQEHDTDASGDTASGTTGRRTEAIAGPPVTRPRDADPPPRPISLQRMRILARTRRRLGGYVRVVARQPPSAATKMERRTALEAAVVRETNRVRARERAASAPGSRRACGRPRAATRSDARRTASSGTTRRTGPHSASGSGLLHEPRLADVVGR